MTIPRSGWTPEAWAEKWLDENWGSLIDLANNRGGYGDLVWSLAGAMAVAASHANSRVVVFAHDIEAERAVLGTMFFAGPLAVDRVRAILDRDDFVLDDHKTLFDVALHFRDIDWPTPQDADFLSAELKRRGHGARDITASIGELISCAVPDARLDWRIRLLRSLSRLRADTREQGKAAETEGA